MQNETREGVEAGREKEHTILLAPPCCGDWDKYILRYRCIFLRAFKASQNKKWPVKMYSDTTR